MFLQLKGPSPWLIEKVKDNVYRIRDRGKYVLAKHETFDDEVLSGLKKERASLNKERASASTAAPGITRERTGVSPNGGDDTRAWIFQANPKYHDIDAAVRALDEMTFTVGQYKNQIHTNDTVYLWKSGPEGGVVAVGSILTEPQPMPDGEGAQFHIDESRFAGEQTRVRLRIEQVLDPILGREELKEHEVLEDLAAFKFANKAPGPPPSTSTSTGLSARALRACGRVCSGRQPRQARSATPT